MIPLLRVSHGRLSFQFNWPPIRFDCCLSDDRGRSGLSDTLPIVEHHGALSMIVPGVHRLVPFSLEFRLSPSNSDTGADSNHFLPVESLGKIRSFNAHCRAIDTLLHALLCLREKSRPRESRNRASLR